MNDFTKEELELILKSIWWGGEDDATEALQKIDDKIQSLVDNYCEHECNGEIEIFTDTCSKCNAYLLREKHYDE